MTSTGSKCTGDRYASDLLQRQHMTMCCAEERGECRAKEAVYQPTHREPELMETV